MSEKLVLCLVLICFQSRIENGLEVEGGLGGGCHLGHCAMVVADLAVGSGGPSKDDGHVSALPRGNTERNLNGLNFELIMTATVTRLGWLAHSLLTIAFNCSAC